MRLRSHRARRRLSRRRLRHQLLRPRAGPGGGVRRRRPRHRRRGDPARRARPSTGCGPAAVLLTHGHVDHVYSVTPVCGGDTAAYIHTDDRYRLHDPLGNVMPGHCSRCSSSSSAGGPRGASPSTSSRSRDREAPRARRARRRGAARARAHRGLGDVRPRRGARRAAARGRGPGPHHGQRRRALRRLDRPHRPARRRPRGDAAARCATSSCRCPTPRSCSPATAPATTMRRERATNPYLRGLTA